MSCLASTPTPTHYSKVASIERGQLLYLQAAIQETSADFDFPIVSLWLLALMGPLRI